MSIQRWVNIFILGINMYDIIIVSCYIDINFYFLLSYFLTHNLCNRPDCPRTAIKRFITPLPTPPTTLQLQWNLFVKNEFWIFMWVKSRNILCYFYSVSINFEEKKLPFQHDNILCVPMTTIYKNTHWIYHSVRFFSLHVASSNKN